MKFKYKRIRFPSSPAFPERKYLLRPIIPLLVACKGKAIGYEVLLDSGADFCIFHAEIGEYLGLNIQSGPKEFFGGITGKRATAFVHRVGLTIGGNCYLDVPIGFSFDIPRDGHGVLGHEGFFNIFRVIFDLKKEQIELKPRS